MNPLLAFIRAELGLTLRQGEQLLVSFGIPLAALVFFSQVDVLPLTRDPLDHLTPAVIALSVMSAAMVSLGISTAFERNYGVLRRLGVTPLGRPRLVLGKVLTVLTVIALQVVLVLVVASVLGWSPAESWLGALAAVVPAVVLGTAAFGGLGMLFAGTMPALRSLAVINAVYLMLAFAGGIAVPLDELPTVLSTVGELLPSGALTNVLMSALSDNPASGSAWIVLVGWAVASPLLAVKTFRWD